MYKPTILFFTLLISGKLFSQKTEFLAAYDIAADFVFNDKRLGGISGIDYNKKENKYYLISDDRSIFDKARFYKASIYINKSTIDSVRIKSVTYLKDNNKNFYKTETADCESIRIMPNRKLVLIGDEGGNAGKPGISLYDTSGSYYKSLPLRNSFIGETRSNKSFESLTLLSEKNRIVFATEVPLKKDGKESDFENNGLLRIIKANIKTGKFIYQASYMLDKLKPEYHNKYNQCDIGLSELLMLNKNHFITLERAGIKVAENEYDFDCRLYFVTLKKNKTGNGFRYKTEKKELFRFSEFEGGRKNFEGICFGPVVNGKKTIVVVSDNNFSNAPTTFFLLSFNPN